jgi:hypothetical protein
MKTRGTIVIEVAIILAAIGLGLFVKKPEWFSGESKRAANSTAATQRVEEATTAVGASAAAGVTSIGRAANDLPDSPATDFVRREVPAVLAKLPAPDPLALLEAERRRAAVMEGRYNEANRLYNSEALRSEKLQKELNKALQARREADLDLQKAAAVSHADSVRIIVLSIIGVLLFAGWCYAKLYGVGPETLGKIAADARAGIPVIQSLDTHLAPWMHPRVNRAARYATELKDPE